MIVLKQVQDFMRSWTAVIDVSENMQLVDGESLDDVCDGNDKGTLGNDLRTLLRVYLLETSRQTATRWWIVI